MSHWLPFSTVNDMVTVALVVVLVVFGLLFMGLMVANKFTRKP